MPRGWPLLHRAPFRLVRAGSIGAMILVSVALLAGLFAAGPLFGSATAAGGLAQRLATIPETTGASLRPVVQVTVFNGPQHSTEPQIKALVDAVPDLGRPVTSVWADAWQLDERQPVPYALAGGTREAAVLYFRTGAVDALKIAAGQRGTPGLWVPEGMARDLHLQPGSMVEVGKTYRYDLPSCGSPLNRLSGKVPAGGQSQVKVAGIYRTAADGRLPMGEFFAHLGVSLPGDPASCPTPAALLIGDRGTIDTALAVAKEQPLWTYTASLTAVGQTPAHLRTAAAAAGQLRLAASEPGTPESTVMQQAATDSRVDTGLPAIQAQAEADATVARQQGRGIAYAGGALGLAAVVVALRALAQRRRRESELLLGLGTPTRVVIGAGTIELLVPTLLGALAGWAAATLAFKFFGPQPQLDPAAVRLAAVSADEAAVVTLVASALVTLAQIRQVSRSLAGAGISRLGSPWLPLLTGATVLVVIATLTRERGRSYSDPMAALLPILVLACGCAVVARLASATAAAVRRWRSGPAGEPAAASTKAGGAEVDRLVLRGLRRTGVAVADLVVIMSVGIGVLAYGLFSATQVHQSVDDKAAVLAGAPSTAHIPYSWLMGGGEGPSPNLGAGTTAVWRAHGQVNPDNRVFQILVVDPDALSNVASWGSGQELADARTALRSFGALAPEVAAAPGSPQPALLIGPSERRAGTTAQLQIGSSITTTVKINQRLEAFPGVLAPTLVFDARTFFSRLDPSLDPTKRTDRPYDLQGDFATWLWTRSSLPVLRQRVLDRGLPLWQSSTLTQARATPALTSSEWAATYQVVLGLAAAALAGLAVVVAVDRRVARAAPVDLLLKRFGVRPARLLWLRTLELVATGAGALAVLVAPLALMVVLLPRLIEPDPALTPSMPVRVNALPLVLSVAAAAVLVVVAALAAARRSAALVPSEVLRDDA